MFANKNISKLSTLDAARTVYFIIVGLAIKESLTLFSNSKTNYGSVFLHGGDQYLICIGYLATVIRFAHGISLLYGFEKERVEKTTLPSAGRIMGLSFFLVVMGIMFFLMGHNIARFNPYVKCTVLLFIFDFIYIWLSGVVRKPLKKFVNLRRDTSKGYISRAALHWMLSDIVLILLCIVVYYLQDLFDNYKEIYLGIFLILFAILDYVVNYQFYFGGQSFRNRKTIAFVCSPLRPKDGKTMSDNVAQAQFYCKNLMELNTIPFASHAFYTYFLDDDDPLDRLLGRECALSFLYACNAIYVFVPMKNYWWNKNLLKSIDNSEAEDNKLLRLPNKKWQELHLGFLGLETENLSQGMEEELAHAKKFGLHIRYLPTLTLIDIEKKHLSKWEKLSYREENAEGQHSDVQLRKHRKRVYVCSQLRGNNWDNLSEQEKKQRVNINIKAALWYCHELVRKESVAPFAPQAFYPYFVDVLDSKTWNQWFTNSLGLLTICDALYVYTKDGLPSNECISSGMKQIIRLGESLGIDIQYCMMKPAPDSWSPCLPFTIVD